jgi:hypothetical protein
MPILTIPSSAARTALAYITVGSLTLVWSGIWYSYMTKYPPERDFTWFWCYGFLLTGLALFVIGLAIGQIGRSARHAELPPPEITAAVAQIDQNAASRAPMIAPVNPAAQTIVPPGQPAAPNGQGTAAPVVPAAVPAAPLS